ncbi:hypothetical protein WR25_07858 [Diploscapter pachys]|uniref:F-box domain-containing protein n=1 Tax=Diploscapter pachys TaxID=2018661 RepID=A0A2A2LGX6_9BILA|nr:hypothetical protein WR25_07858 [Diploscapter pachys]
MLNNFPVEIVTECLLGLGIYDLLQIVKTNRRLYAIAHAEKSPLRHRLKKHFSIGLQLHTYSSLGLVEEDEVECQEEGRVRPQMHLAFDNENPIREIESVTLRVDRKAEPIPDSDRYSHCFELKFWSKCCNKHDANKEVKYEPDDIRYPEQLVAKMNDLHWPPTPQMMMIDIKHRNKEEALQNLVLFWHYLSSYYIVRGEYCVKINNDLSPWTALEPFFRENPTNIRSGPWIDLSHVEIEPETFFANPAFNYGFYRFYYGKVQAIDDPTNRSLYHRMLRQTSYVYIYDDLTGSGLDDENLCLFKDTERFSIGCSTSVTPNGWAKLVEYYYKAWRWMENISIRVNGDFPVQSLVSLIPKENYEYRTEKGHQGEDKPTFIVTNVHGELFKISVLYFIEIGPIYDDEDDYLPEEEALLKVKERKEKMKDESSDLGVQ